jgi:hypothetical protein
LGTGRIQLKEEEREREEKLGRIKFREYSFRITSTTPFSSGSALLK